MNKSLPDGNYVFLFDGLKRNPGGITRVMMNRANSFIQNGADVKILIDGRSINQLDNVKIFQQRGYTYVQERNFVYWADFLGNELMDENLVHELDCMDFFKVERESIICKDNDTVLYYMQGKLIAKECITDEKTRQIDFVDEFGVTYQRHTVREGRLISCTEYIRFPDGKERKVITRFFSKNHFVFACIVKENNCEKITLFDEKNRKVLPISTNGEMREYFWRTFIRKSEEKNVFVFCDIIHYQDPFFDKLRTMGSKKIYTIAILHDVGYRKGKMSPVTRKLLENNECDAFVTLTRQALYDYQNELGEKNFIYCVNNPVNLPKNVIQFHNRKKRLIFIGRIAPVKQIEHVIEVFGGVSKLVSDLELHIVGFSSVNDSQNEYEKKIIELVKNMRGDNIHLKGYSDNVGAEYQNSLIGLFCSRSEAFPLSLVECSANGCVPVSYDFKYGPRDIIKDGETGLIVESNVDEMITAIQQLINDRERLEIMSQNAISDAYRFSAESVYGQWVNILNDIIEKRVQTNGGGYKSDINWPDALGKYGGKRANGTGRYTGEIIVGENTGTGKSLFFMSGRCV